MAMPPSPQQRLPQQNPAVYGGQAGVPYASGTTAYGAVLPRNVANVANMPQAEGGYTLGPGDKVKITLRFRGREMAHQDLGRGKLTSIANQLSEYGWVEAVPREPWHWEYQPAGQ